MGYLLTGEAISANLLTGEATGMHLTEALVQGVFEQHITSFCKKGSQKLHALARIAHYMDFKKPRSLMKSFEILQFNLCPLIWMFHSRALNNRINKLHERALRLVLQNKNLSFNELTKLGNAVTIHQRNLEVFVPVIFKVKNNLSPEIKKQGFEFQEPYYNYIKTTHYDIQSVRFLGPKIWAMVSQDIKNCESLRTYHCMKSVCIRSYSGPHFPAFELNKER